MALTQEWSRRVRQQIDALPKFWATEVGRFELEGFTTVEQLTPAAAARGRFRPMPPGTKWGAMWEYAWFRAKVRIPAEAAGECVVATVPQGNECFVLVDGRHAGLPQDRRRRFVELTPRARPGERHSILLEAYAGHGPTPCWLGPAPRGGEAWADPKPPLQTVQPCALHLWEEDLFQLWLDLLALWEICGKLGENELRVAEIDAGLRDASCLLDLDAPRAERLASSRRARARLRPLLACRNGSTAPTLYAFGHAHLDVAWLWPWQETERKMVRTISNVVALARRYPEYRYLQSQPHLFWMMKRRYPSLYAEIKRLARRGNLIPDGAMWIEADTNVSGGEALIRQCLHGRRFFREEFGVESRGLWLPDVFGYSGALPQILRGCGVEWFSTQKIYWAYNGGDPFPLQEFWWEGIDGTAIATHFHQDYNSLTRPGTLIDRWNGRRQKDGFAATLLPYGHGDGGGGPEREHLEFLRRCRDLEGVPRVRHASPDEFFRDLARRGGPRARYVGELYFQAHRGVMTSQARTKRGNRRSEFALREAEFWTAAASALAGFRAPARELEDAWRRVLLNQFHDILPGSSIGRVYDEANREFDRAIESAAGVARRAAARIAPRRGGALTVFNSLPWERRELVALPPGAARAAAVPVQRIGGTAWAEVDLPACGWATLPAGRPPRIESALRAAPDRLENEHLRVRFNRRGEIASLYDKDAGRELAAGPCNAFRMWRDDPVWFEAWDIDSSYPFMPVALDADAKIEVVAAGPLAAVLRIARRLHDSDLVQEVWLRRGSRRLDFRSTVEWREHRKLLKVCFPVRVHADHALHEIQFGHLARPNHASRPFDADRFEVAQQKWTALAETGRGAAVLNDGKYGVNVVGQSINLTLLRAPVAPDKKADLGRQEFAYAFYAWNGGLHESGLVREGYALNVPAWAVAGDGGGRRSVLSVDRDNIVVETLKPAEDGSGDLVVRLYESARLATRGTLHVHLPVRAASFTNLVEESPRRAPLSRGRIALEFRPFEIKTLRLRPA